MMRAERRVDRALSHVASLAPAGAAGLARRLFNKSILRYTMAPPVTTAEDNIRGTPMRGLGPRAIAAAFALALASCAAHQGIMLNTLSAHERADGWRLLFDGTSTTGWRAFQGQSASDNWAVADGTLSVVKPGADLISVDTYANFELDFDWRMSEGGNSGVMFNVVEDDHDTTYSTGPEYQLLDDAKHSDGANPKHRAGANYDLEAPRAAAARAVGEWNQARIIVDHGHVQHWLNGQLVVDYELWTPQWEAEVAASKFATMPDYGRAHAGHIALQDHGDRVWFRNIRIKEL
jgi:3-keto-disaccharide hydrolase